MVYFNVLSQYLQSQTEVNHILIVTKIIFPSEASYQTYENTRRHTREDLNSVSTLVCWFSSTLVLLSSQYCGDDKFLSTFVFLSYEYLYFTVTNRLLYLVGISITNFGLSFILLNKWADIKRCIAKHIIFIEIYITDREIWQQDRSTGDKFINIFKHRYTRRTAILGVRPRFHPYRGHEGPEGQYRYRPNIYFSSTLDEGRWSTAILDSFTPGKESWSLLQKHRRVIHR